MGFTVFYPRFSPSAAALGGGGGGKGEKPNKNM
jgi:hypothetical protein